MLNRNLPLTLLAALLCMPLPFAPAAAQPGWAAEVKAKNGGRPVDIILEMTGGAVFEEALDCLAPFGRMVAYGNASRQPMFAAKFDVSSRTSAPAAPAAEPSQ